MVGLSDKDLLWILLVGGGLSSSDLDLSNICMDERNKGMVDAITTACFCPGATIGLVSSSSSSLSNVGNRLLDQCYVQLKGSLVTASNSSIGNIAAPSLSARDLARICALLRQVAINDASTDVNSTMNSGSRKGGFTGTGEAATSGTASMSDKASLNTAQALEVLESQLLSFAEMRRRQVALLMAERAIVTSTLACSKRLNSNATVTLVPKEAPERVQELLGASSVWVMHALVHHVVRQRSVEPKVCAEALMWAWRTGRMAEEPRDDDNNVSSKSVTLLSSMAALVYGRGYPSPSSGESNVCKEGLEVCVHVVQMLLVEASGNRQEYDECFRLDCHDVLGHAVARVLCSCDYASQAWVSVVNMFVPGYFSRALQARPHLYLADASNYLRKVLQHCGSVVPLHAYTGGACVEAADLPRAVMTSVLETCPHPKMAFSGAVVASVLQRALASGAKGALDVLHELRPYLIEHPEVFLALLLVATKAALTNACTMDRSSSSTYADVNAALSAAFHYLATLRSDLSPYGLALSLVQMSCSSCDPCPSEPWTVKTLVANYDSPFVMGYFVLQGLASPQMGERLCTWLVEHLYRTHPSRAVGALLVATAIHSSDMRPLGPAAPHGATVLRATFKVLVKEMRDRGREHARVAEILRSVAGELERVRVAEAAAAVGETGSAVFQEAERRVPKEQEKGAVDEESTSADLVRHVVTRVFAGDTTECPEALRMEAAKTAGRLAVSLWLHGGASDMEALEGLVSTCLATEKLSELLAFHRDEADYDTAMHMSLHAPVESVFLPQQVPMSLSHIGRSAVRLELILSPPTAYGGRGGSGLQLLSLPTRTIAAVHFISGLFLSQTFETRHRCNLARVLTDDMERVLHAHAGVLVPQLLATIHAHHFMELLKNHKMTASTSAKHHNLDQSPSLSAIHATAAYCAACTTLARHLSEVDRVTYIGTLLAHPGNMDLSMAVALGVGYSHRAKDLLVKEMLVLCEDVVPDSTTEYTKCSAHWNELVGLPLWAVLSVLRVFHGIPSALASRVHRVLRVVDAATLYRLHGLTHRWDFGVAYARPSTERNICAEEWSFDTLISSEHKMVCVHSCVRCSAEALTIEIQDVRDACIGTHDSGSRYFFRTTLGIDMPVFLPVVSDSSNEQPREASIVVLPSFQGFVDILTHALGKLQPFDDSESAGSADVTEFVALFFQLLKYFYPTVSNVVGDDWLLYSLCALRTYGASNVHYPPPVLLTGVLDALLSQCACDSTLGDLRRAILRTVMYGNPLHMSMSSPSSLLSLSRPLSHDPVRVIATLSSHFVAARGVVSGAEDGAGYISTLGNAVEASISRSSGGALCDVLSRDDAVKIISCCVCALNIMSGGVDQFDFDSDTKQVVRTIVSSVVNRRHARTVAVEMGNQKSRHRWTNAALHEILSALGGDTDADTDTDADKCVSGSGVERTGPGLRNTWHVELGSLHPPQWLYARPWVSTNKGYDRSTPKSPRDANVPGLHSGPTPITPSKRRMELEFAREDGRCKVVKTTTPNNAATTHSSTAGSATGVVRPVPRKLASGVNSRDSTPSEVLSQSPVLDSGEEDWGDDEEVPWEERTEAQQMGLVKNSMPSGDLVEGVAIGSAPGFSGVSIGSHGAELGKEVDKWKDTADIASKFAVSF